MRKSRQRVEINVFSKLYWSHWKLMYSSLTIFLNEYYHQNLWNTLPKVFRLSAEAAFLVI